MCVHARLSQSLQLSLVLAPRSRLYRPCELRDGRSCVSVCQLDVRKKIAVDCDSTKSAKINWMGWCRAGVGDEETPQKGLFSLPFMARAAERQKRAAAAEAARLLRDIEGDELATGTAGGGRLDADGVQSVEAAAEETVSGPGRRTFGGAAATRRGQAADGEAEPDRWALRSDPVIPSNRLHGAQATTDSYLVHGCWTTHEHIMRGDD